MDPLTPAEREIAERCETIRTHPSPFRRTNENARLQNGALDTIETLLAALRHERQKRVELEAALQDLLNAIKST
jgi:hypothetical protein